MILATDVQYDDEAGTALVAGVGFQDHRAAEPDLSWTVPITSGIGAYVPGNFAQRELGCLLKLLIVRPGDPSCGPRPTPGTCH